MNIADLNEIIQSGTKSYRDKEYEEARRKDEAESKSDRGNDALSARPGVSDVSAAASAAITDCFVHSFRFKLARGVGRFCEATGGLAGRSRLQHPAPGGPAAARPEPDAASDLSWPPTQAAASSLRAPPA